MDQATAIVCAALIPTITQIGAAVFQYLHETRARRETEAKVEEGNVTAQIVNEKVDKMKIVAVNTESKLDAVKVIVENGSKKGVTHK